MLKNHKFVLWRHNHHMHDHVENVTWTFFEAKRACMRACVWRECVCTYGVSAYVYGVRTYSVCVCMSVCASAYVCSHHVSSVFQIGCGI